MEKKKEIDLSTSSYFHFLSGEFFIRKFGSLSLLTKLPKEITTSSTKASTLIKSTEKVTANMIVPGASRLPLWRTDGAVLATLLHIGPVEFLYYWFYRALHHHFLFSRYHSHHHSSIVTEPTTSVIHPFAEHMVYFLLFAIPLMATVFTGTSSLITAFGYVTYIDFMNSMGHCNFEFIPKWVFSIFPFLKYLMYTPSLFMPIYDIWFNTVDKSSDVLYETSLKSKVQLANVVHLTHLITPQSIYHLRLGFATSASMPLTRASRYVVWLTWPYCLQWQQEAVNRMIEEAIQEADNKGVKVFTLGLLNQSEELNRHGEIYIERNPQLKVRVVDGSSLAAAIVINSIPKGTTQVLFRGTISKVAQAIAYALCKKGIQVAATNKDDYEMLKLRLGGCKVANLVHSDSYYASKIWLVGDGLKKEEQARASKKTLFIPYSQFYPQQLRKDSSYYTTPAMIIPKSLENMHSCENWLPRGVMSAWRIAGIVHALENWNTNECGDFVCNIDYVWKATLHHGFNPISA
ncbi:hypothetical protein ACFE04_022661 [Oxalis oulophora]